MTLNYDHLQNLLKNLADAEAAVEAYLAKQIDASTGDSPGTASATLLRDETRTIAHSHLRSTHLVSRTAAVILELDSSGVIRFANNAIEKATGYPPAELIGQPMSILASPSQSEQLAKLQQLWNHNDVVDRELSLTSRNSKPIYLQVSSTNLRVGGNARGVLLFGIDVTARKQAELDQQRLAFDLQKRVKELTALQYITRLLLRPPGDLRYIASEIAGILPSAFQFPDAAAARVQLGEDEVTTAGFETTPWTIRSESHVQRSATVILEVAYRTNPTQDDNPFLPEEYSLLRSMTDMLLVYLERQQSESALRESEQRFRELAETIHEVFWVTAPKSTNVQYVSPAYDDIFGHNREQLYRDSNLFFNAIHKEDLQLVLDMLATHESGRPGFCEYRIIKSDGSIRWMRDRGYPVFDEKGNVKRIVGVVEDITDHKLAEMQLRASEAKYRRLFDTDIMGIFEWDLSGTIYDANNALLKLLGYGRDDLEAGRLNWRTISSSQSSEADDHAVNEVLATGTAFPFEKEFVHKDGTIIPVLMGVAAFEHRNDRGVAFVLDQRDKKRSEGLLIQQKEMLQTIIDSIPTMIAMFDPDGNLTFVNKEWERSIEWTLEECQSEDVLEHLYPDEEYRHWVYEFIAQASGEWGDFRTRCKNGSVLDTIWCNVRLSDGTIIGFGQDISERKSYERQLTQTNEALHALIDASPLAIVSYDDVGTATIWNSAAELMFGWSRQEVLGKTIPGYEAGEWEPLAELLVKESRGDQMVEVEKRRFSRNGSPIEVSVSTAVLRQPGDTPRGVLKIITDISERKQREEKLCLLEAAVEQANDSIVITDASVDEAGPRIVFVNPAFTRITGYPEHEVLGKTPRILQGPKTEPTVIDRLIKDLLHGRPFADETVNYRKNGEEFINHWHIAPIRNNGVVTHFVAIQRDVTKQKSAESALRESEERFRELVQNIPQVFWITDASYSKILYMSPMTEQLWGRPANAIYENPRILLEVIHPADLSLVQRSFADLRQGNECELTFRIVRRDGEIRHIRSVGRPIKDSDGKVLRLAGIAEDITEFANLQTQLLQANKMEAIGKLAGGVAHDFNNILTGIIGFVKLLIQNTSDEAARRDLMQIHSLTQRATGLTTQLLLFSRKQAMVTSRFDLNEVVESDSKLLARLIGEDIFLDCRPTDEPIFINADRSRIEQVLFNLAVNARDAMPKGGQLTIETDSRDIMDEQGMKPGSYAVLRVSDNGCGMPDEVKPHIFEPFFTTKEVGQGTGLGLSTVYGVVAEHAGVVRVQSEVGIGTTIEILLPRVRGRVELPAVADPEEYSLEGDEGILLVEDEDAVRDLLARVLIDYGYQVTAAATPAEAAAMFVDDPDSIELLVTDVIMPGVDGRQLYERLCDWKPELKVIYISGYTDSVIVSRGVLDQETQFLQKPFEPNQLIKLIRRVLDERST